MPALGCEDIPEQKNYLVDVDRTSKKIECTGEVIYIFMECPAYPPIFSLR